MFTYNDVWKYPTLPQPGGGETPGLHRFPSDHHVSFELDPIWLLELPALSSRNCVAFQPTQSLSRQNVQIQIDLSNRFKTFGYFTGTFGTAMNCSLRFAGRYPTKKTSHRRATAADPIQGGVVAGASLSSAICGKTLSISLQRIWSMWICTFSWREWTVKAFSGRSVLFRVHAVCLPQRTVLREFWQLCSASCLR